MRRTSQFVMLILCALLMITACGGNPTNEDSSSTSTDSAGAATREAESSAGSGTNNADAPSSLRVEGFSVTVTGGATVDFGGSGSIACENNRYALRAATGDLPQIAITLPPGTEAGSHPIGQMGGSSTGWGSLTLADNSVYAGNVNGMVVLNQFNPQQIQGSFAFSASNGRNTIDAQGTFNFVPASFPLRCG